MSDRRMFWRCFSRAIAIPITIEGLSNIPEIQKPLDMNKQGNSVNIASHALRERVRGWKAYHDSPNDTETLSVAVGRTGFENCKKSTNIQTTHFLNTVLSFSILYVRGSQIRFLIFVLPSWITFPYYSGVSLLIQVFLCIQDAPIFPGNALEHMILAWVVSPLSRTTI